MGQEETHFIGEIVAYAGTAVPSGNVWLECNGQTVLISNYQALFSVVGTMYGGNGITTFAVPDLRGRTCIHHGTGPGLAGSFVQGQTGGTESVTLSLANLPPHTHDIMVNHTDSNTPNPAGAYFAQTAADKFRAASTPSNMHASCIEAYGFGQSFNNMDGFLSVMFLIAASNAVYVRQ